jgi:hypothetical protein
MVTFIYMLAPEAVRGGDRFGIGRHFHYQILAAPCSVDDVPTWVAMLATWVAMRSQEALQLWQ